MSNPKIMVPETHPAIVGYVLWLFGGIFGAHRFYFGRRWTGLLYLCTGALLGIGWIVDIFLIPGMAEAASRKYPPGKLDYNVAWLLLVYLGYFGAHRFYQEKWISGIIYLFTGGLFFVGYFYDWFTMNEQLMEQNSDLIV